MGTESFWIPAVISAVAAGGEYANQTSAAKRQDQANAQGIREQSEIQQKAASRVGETVRQIQKSDPNADARAATSEYTQQLRKNASGSRKPGATSALGSTPGSSKRYQGDRAAAAGEVADYGATYAGQMGAADGAVRQREGEGFGLQDLSSSLGTLSGESYGRDFVNRLRAQAAGRSNPWVTLGTSLLRSGASAYAANAGPGWTPDAGVMASGPNAVDSAFTGWVPRY